MILACATLASSEASAVLWTSSNSCPPPFAANHRANSIRLTRYALRHGVTRRAHPRRLHQLCFLGKRHQEREHLAITRSPVPHRSMLIRERCSQLLPSQASWSSGQCARCL